MAAAKKAEEQAAAKKAEEEAAAKQAEEEAAARKAARQAAEKAAQLALGLNSVDYNDAGDMTFAGHAVPGSTVRLYVDNGFLADTTANLSGNWTFAGHEKIAVGDHQLRANSVDAEGNVVARIELPFARAGQEEVAALQKSRDLAKQAGSENTTKKVEQPQTEAPAKTQQTVKAEEPAKTEEAVKIEQPAKTQEPAKTEEPVKAPAMPQEPARQQVAKSTEQTAEQPVAKVGRVVIQPGNNLWRISRIIYGKGHEYTVIYQANRDAIRNPNLIYPGRSSPPRASCRRNLSIPAAVGR